MQIKSIAVAAGALACMVLAYSIFAAGARDVSGAASSDDRTAMPGEMVRLAAMSEEKAGLKTGQASQGLPAQQDMANAEKPAAAVSVRNTRPKMDRHKDARACLEAANNKAVIKCANRYR